MLSALPFRRIARDTRGFTLMETLVAMITGVVVTGALFAILEVSMTQSTRLSDVAQATQLGRTAMTRIVDELHSTCINAAFTPIQAGSNENELIFQSAYSEQAEIPSGRMDKIVWNKATGTLTDNVYLSSGGSWPTFKFENPPSQVRIAEHISEAESETKKGEPVPIFRYYAYATKSSTTPTAASSTLEEGKPLKGTLETKQAATVASVAVAFKAAPNDGKAELGRGVSLSSQTTFAFEAPSSEAPIVAAPCE